MQGQPPLVLGGELDELLARHGEPFPQLSAELGRHRLQRARRPQGRRVALEDALHPQRPGKLDLVERADDARVLRCHLGLQGQHCDAPVAHHAVGRDDPLTHPGNRVPQRRRPPVGSQQLVRHGPLFFHPVEVGHHRTEPVEALREPLQPAGQLDLQRTPGRLLRVERIERRALEPAVGQLRDVLVDLGAHGRQLRGDRRDLARLGPLRLERTQPGRRLIGDRDDLRDLDRRDDRRDGGGRLRPTGRRETTRQHRQRARSPDHRPHHRAPPRWPGPALSRRTPAPNPPPESISPLPSRGGGC